MKALYITYDGLSDPLGQSQILPYIKGLASSHMKWTILSFEKKGNQDPIIKKIDGDLAHQDIRWIKISYHRNFNILFKIYDLICGTIKLICNQEKYDVIHVRSYIAALLGFIPRRRYPSKFIFDMRGFWPEERIESGLWKRGAIQYKLFKFFEYHFIKTADVVVVLTEKAKQILGDTSRYPLCKEIAVIPTCVDTTKFSYQKEKKIALSLCYSGSLGTWYCLDEMLAFFQCLKTQYADATLTLLINWTSLQQIDPGTIFKLNSIPGLKIDSCSYDDLPSYLNTTHLGIFFIKPLPSKRASCPTKLGEFLAMGIPLIINRGIGDCDEWIEKEGLGILIDDFSQDSYYRALTNMTGIMQDKEIQNRCARFARQHLSLQRGISEYKRIFSI